MRQIHKICILGILSCIVLTGCGTTVVSSQTLASNADEFAQEKQTEQNRGTVEAVENTDTVGQDQSVEVYARTTYSFLQDMSYLSLPLLYGADNDAIRSINREIRAIYEEYEHYAKAGGGDREYDFCNIKGFVRDTERYLSIVIYGWSYPEEGARTILRSFVYDKQEQTEVMDTDACRESRITKSKLDVAFEQALEKQLEEMQIHDKGVISIRHDDVLQTAFYMNEEGIPEFFSTYPIYYEYAQETGSDEVLCHFSDWNWEIGANLEDIMEPEFLNLIRTGACVNPEQVDYSFEGFLPYDMLTLSEADQTRYPKLKTALDTFNNTEDATLRGYLDATWPQIQEDEGAYYSVERHSYPMRADETVVSIVTRETPWEQAMVSDPKDYGINLEPNTGERLLFTDLLTEDGWNHLASILARTVTERYTEDPLLVLSAMQDRIQEALDREEGISCCLGYDRITCYLDASLVTDTPHGSYAVEIAFQEEPDLVRPRYAQQRYRYMTRLLPGDETHHLVVAPEHVRNLQIREENGTDPETGEWNPEEDVRIQLDHKNTTQTYYHNGLHNLYLGTIDGRNYLLLQVPVGDVSFPTDIYDLNGAAPELLVQSGGSIREDGPQSLDPYNLSMIMFNEDGEDGEWLRYYTGGLSLDGELYDFGPWEED